MDATTPTQWVQTDRATHTAWAGLIRRAPRAAMLLHVLVAQMDATVNAVIAPQRLLADLCGCSVDTIRRAIAVLAAERWVQIVDLGPGTTRALVINSRVAWGQARGNLRMAAFSATVLADARDQFAAIDDDAPLRTLPPLFAGEMQVPNGDDAPPPSQPSLHGMEAPLPVRQVKKAKLRQERKALQKRSQRR